MVRNILNGRTSSSVARFSLIGLTITDSSHQSGLRSIPQHCGNSKQGQEEAIVGKEKDDPVTKGVSVLRDDILIIGRKWVKCQEG